MEKVNRDTLLKAINHCWDNNLVPFITSSPGEGKSELIYSLADGRDTSLTQTGREKLKLISICLTNHQPEDFLGLPFKNQVTNKAEFLPFDLFPTEDDDIPKGYDGWILFIDELASSKGPIQTAAQMLILERKVGNKKLHPNVRIVCAGNRLQDRANVTPLSTALKTRMITFELAMETKEWIEWALVNDIDYRIVAFMNFDPTNLSRFNAENEVTSFACPRTWFHCSKLIKHIEDLSHVPFFVSGSVGDDITPSFLVFAKHFLDLPTIQEITYNPLKTKIPVRKEQQFAIIQTLVYNCDDNNIDSIFDYVNRFEPEFKIIFGKQANKRNPLLIKTNEKFRKFIIDMV